MAETMIAISAAVSSATAATTAAISSMFAGTTAAAGTAAAGSAAAGSTAAASAGVLGTGISASSISTALSIGSALSSIAGGYAKAEATRDQARQLGVQTAQFKAGESQKRATAAEEYADLIADQEAVQIANGLNPGYGTPASVRTATTSFSERNLSTSRENTRMRAQTARMQQRSLFKGANNAILSGWTQAAATGAGAFQAVG